MIVSKMIPMPDFWVCAGSVSANESVEHENTKLSYYNDCMYIVEGAASVTDGTTTVDLVAGQLANLRPLRGNNTTFNIGANQTTWIAFNPKRLDQDLNVTIHSDNQTVTGECVIYCMLGSITVNDNTVKSEQFVRVAENTSVNVTATSQYAIVRT